MSDAPGLSTILSRPPDPRIERPREHELTDLPAIAACTRLAGGESCSDMEGFGHARKAWLQTFLRLPGGIPGHAVANPGRLRRLAVNLLRRDQTCKRGARGGQLNAALKPGHLLRLLTAPSTSCCVSPAVFVVGIPSG